MIIIENINIPRFVIIEIDNNNKQEYIINSINKDEAELTFDTILNSNIDNENYILILKDINTNITIKSYDSNTDKR